MKQEEQTKQTETAEKVYPTQAILESAALKGFQKDFARALLTKPAYTMREAQVILTKFFGGDR